MSRLLTIQNQFQNYLLNDEANFKNLIISTEKVSAETRLAIYHNAYRLRLIEALESNYPVLNMYLGTDIFEKIASEYIDQYPSYYRSIRWFGDCLATFLNGHQEYQSFPYLSELAAFEWMQTLVFDAADSAILQIEEMTKIPPASWMTMRLRPHPSLHKINLSWNIVAIWQAITENETLPEPVESSSPVPWILWRRDFMNRFSSLPEDESWALDMILKDCSFGEICEGLCQWVSEDEAGPHAAALLKVWIQSGLLAEVIV